jgi:hypothetical protein
MGIIARAMYGDPIPVKEGESVQVRLVDVSNDRTGTVTQRVDVRIYVETERYTGWSKTGFQIDDPQKLRDLAAAFLAAADGAEKAGMKPGNGTTVPQVPVVPVVNVNTGSVAARKALARNAKVKPTTSGGTRARRTTK